MNFSPCVSRCFPSQWKNWDCWEIPRCRGPPWAGCHVQVEQSQSPNFFCPRSILKSQTRSLSQQAVHPDRHSASGRHYESYWILHKGSYRYSGRAQFFVVWARSTWQCTLIGWWWRQNHCSVMSCCFCNKLVLWGNRLLPLQPWPWSSCPWRARRQSAGDDI